MKLSIKKLLIPAAIAISVAASVPAFVGADFSLEGLNTQVQNHEARITTLESASPSPSPTPAPATAPAILSVEPGSPSGGITTTHVVTGGTLTNPTEAPVPPTTVVSTATPTPGPGGGSANVSGLGGSPTPTPVPPHCYIPVEDPVTHAVENVTIPCS